MSERKYNVRFQLLSNVIYPLHSWIVLIYVYFARLNCYVIDKIAYEVSKDFSFCSFGVRVLKRFSAEQCITAKNGLV
ncbi:hypothetical protein SPHINGO8BC_60372 [Sphingobacterium multivorum]|uniref:Uncharacterized protein n=1 Tax=Sphingobacterium multivorum TaxID=28454 RepID=A0A654DI46_SPHMU|nr:hypothetical protein SPHINGO8BC_60372 [Sphingobacterium multivorum]